MQPKEEFLITNKFDESDLDILKAFKKIKSDKNIKEITSRKPDWESENSFILSIAKNYKTNNKKLFRKKHDSKDDLTNIWLSIVENKATNYFIEKEIKPFTGLHYDSLSDIAKLSNNVESLKKIDEILRKEYGIIILYEKSFKGLKLDGCAFNLPNNSPVIAMSLRYSRYDYFWFTLMHELSHVSLHHDMLSTPIIDDLENESQVMTEIEANRAASESLIPIEANRSLFRTKDEPQTLLAVCKKFSINPIVAAGAVRKKHNNYRIFSDLVNSINVRMELGFDD
ncbi:ImmA/IrrE family metallo-endopeptidase [Erwinia tasmaniensis]|uniref:ImmA/IrrE family metallo-endopeptidase n=1 Tax=Erwinia tasmaniensis TaxID=338565 RepID=UPI003A4D2220